MADTLDRDDDPDAATNIPRSTDAPKSHTPWGTVGGRVICMVSRKGGVGKTTSAVNLGAALALSGHTVLLVGTDPQCGVCRSLGCKPEDLPVSLTDLFDCGERIQNLVQVSPLAGLHFLSPRVPTLEDEERFLSSLERRTAEFVREIDRARSLYDTIIIDCPPGMGAAARAALLAADGFLVPVQAEELCRESLPSLLEFIDEFRARNFELTVAGEIDGGTATLSLEGMFLTMANGRTRVGRHVAARVTEDFGNMLYDAQVPRTTRLAEMSMRGRPAVIYDRRSPGSRAYFDLADELVSRYCRGHGIGEDDVDETEPPVPEQDTAVAAASAVGMRGFERFLYELAGGDADDAPAAMSDGPDLVSLDELLAEEERPPSPSCESDEGYWALDSDNFDRIN